MRVYIIDLPTNLQLVGNCPNIVNPKHLTWTMESNMSIIEK